MTPCSSSITSRTTSCDRELRDLQRHAAGLDALDVEHVVDERRQVLAVGVDALHGARLLLGQLAVEAAHQHQRVAEDGVERRAELVRDVGEELRLGRRRLFERQRLAPQQLVLMRELRRRFAHLDLELRRRLLQLRVEPLALDRFGLIVQHGDDAAQLARAGHHRAGHRFHRHGAAGFGIGDHDALAPALLHAAGAALQHQSRDERRELRDVGLHAALRVLAAAFVRREEALGGRVGHQDVAGRIGHDDRVADRVDEQIEAVALGAHLRLGLHQPPVVLFELLARAPEVGDVAQHRDDGAACRARATCAR